MNVIKPYYCNVRTSILVILCFLMNSAVFSQKSHNKTQSLKGKRVLVFDKNGRGYVHDNREAGRKAFLKMGAENGFAVDTTRDASVFNDAFLKQYCAIVFANTNNEVFDNESQKVSLMRYVQAGGGFVGIHIACGTERNWTWFKQMIGGSFDFHPPFQEFTVKVIDKDHPSTKGLPEIWRVKDELYFFKEMNPSVRVLMVSDFSAIKYDKPLPNTFGKVFPSVWCNTFDGGRQWYTALGHDKADFENPLYLQHILGGLKWVACDKPDYTKAYATKSE